MPVKMVSFLRCSGRDWMDCVQRDVICLDVVCGLPCVINLCIV